MNNDELKKELHALIDTIEDEELLFSLKEDAVAYQKHTERFDDLSDLTKEERAELEALANEDPEKDMISYDEFKTHMQQWLTKLSPKGDL